MKKSIAGFLGFIMLLTLITIVAACGSNPSNVSGSSGNNQTQEDGKKQEVIELYVNNFQPSSGTIAQNVLEPWKQLVEERTEGRVKINLFHGAALGGAPTVYKDVRGGAYDIGSMYSNYHQDTDIFPLTLADLPFMVTSDTAFNTEVMREFFKKFESEMLQDVELISIMSTPPSNFFSTKPIRTVEDFKGLKIRAASKSDADTFREWGAVPVEVAITELYDALQKGIIDAVATGDVLGLDGHLYEVAPHHIELPFKVIHTFMIMNKDTFDKLDKDLKELFRNELFPAYGELNMQANLADQERAVIELAELLKDRGTMTKFPDEELEKLISLTNAVTEKWIETANERGYDGETLIKEFKDIQETLAK